MKPPDIYPVLQYRDAPAAMAWLERAFGCRILSDHRDDSGAVVHAELRLGNGIIMTGSCKDDGPFMLKTPRETGFSTQSIYVVVQQVDALFERAKAAGAEIVWGIRDTDYGSRDFSVRDPEGHLWSFGTYAPELKPD
jgi:uncharacterized glyoxalase superfamily protein PhnB